MDEDATLPPLDFEKTLNLECGLREVSRSVTCTALPTKNPGTRAPNAVGARVPHEGAGSAGEPIAQHMCPSGYLVGSGLRSTLPSLCRTVRPRDRCADAANTGRPTDLHLWCGPRVGQPALTLSQGFRSPALRVKKSFSTMANQNCLVAGKQFTSPEGSVRLP